MSSSADTRSRPGPSPSAAQPRRRLALLPFAPPVLGDEEIEAVVATLRSGWLTSGPRVRQFEEEFRACTGASAALAVSSGTAALHLALVALGIGPGDAVITTPLTFCSTVHAIEQAGAEAVLVDVDPRTLNLDPNAVAARLAVAPTTPSGARIRAILPVHLYGQPCDMDALTGLAARYRLAIVEDAAHALPARWRDRMVGAPLAERSIPHAVAFSFYATKNLTTGEGGMLTASPEIIAAARPLALHGINRELYRRGERRPATATVLPVGREHGWYYEVERSGFKYNLSDLQAALGLAQLRKLPDFHRRRSEIAAFYNQQLRNPALRSLRPLQQIPGAIHAWHLYTVELAAPASDRGELRARFIDEMRDRNIATSVHFIPLFLHPRFSTRFTPDRFPIADAAGRCIVSLPLYPSLSDSEAEDVILAAADSLAAIGL